MGPLKVALTHPSAVEQCVPFTWDLPFLYCLMSKLSDISEFIKGELQL